MQIQLWFSQAGFFPGFDTIETSKTNKECPFFDMAFSRFMRFGSSLKCPQGNLQASFVLIDFEQTLTLALICNSTRGAAGKEKGGGVMAPPDFADLYKRQMQKSTTYEHISSGPPDFWTLRRQCTDFFKNPFSKIVVRILSCKPIDITGWNTFLGGEIVTTKNQQPGWTFLQGSRCKKNCHWKIQKVKDKHTMAKLHYEEYLFHAYAKVFVMVSRWAFYCLLTWITQPDEKNKLVNSNFYCLFVPFHVENNNLLHFT